MFEFLFKYPASVFSKGNFVFLTGWPLWLLLLAVLAVAVGLAWRMWARRADVLPGFRGTRGVIVWLLQTALVALLLFLLWHPALSVATLKPQQNIVAVVLDDSGSMAIKEDGSTRKDQVVSALNGGLLAKLQDRFQTRLYRTGETIQRIDNVDQLDTSSKVTRLGENLKQVVAEAGTLPIGAVILMSDGADNTGGIDLETINEIRRRRIPIHTVGFGKERPGKDIEVTDLDLATRALSDSRLAAQVTIKQFGYTNGKARISIREGGKVLATRDVALKGEGTPQTESVLFNAGDAGAKTIEATVDVLQGEENERNNRLARVVNVISAKPRILYYEGEPRWEYKFMRRAVEDDRNLQLTTILRTTQNKIYRQGIDSPKELEEGFPSKVEDLFAYQGLMIGSVEVASFTPAQIEMIKQFVDRRGGGLMMIAGRNGLGDGGYGKSPLAEILPVNLPDRKGTFQREHANVELTLAGRESLVTRLEENPDKNVERWKKLPYLLDFQDVGTLKPGAVSLAESIVNGKRYPLLVAQNYGRGHVFVMATGGTWRWQMQQPLEDMSHETFWKQLLRALVQETPTRVVASTSKSLLADERKVELRAEVRDTTYLPAGDAQVQATILSPDGRTSRIDLRPNPLEQGVYTGEYSAAPAGSYVTEVLATKGGQEIGRDVITFRREEGVAENFQTSQNRELLEKLAQQTGGSYRKPSDVDKLASEVTFSDAGITVRENMDLWDMPVMFLLALGLRGAEWMLRRRWGVI
jgi:uncharacterized membrane protein